MTVDVKWCTDTMLTLILHFSDLFSLTNTTNKQSNARAQQDYLLGLSLGKYIKRSHYIHLRDLHSQLRNVCIVIAAVNSKYIYMRCNIFNIERLSVLNHICKSNHPQHHRQDNSMPSEDESMWGSKQEKQLRMRTSEETWESRSEGNNVQWGATGESTKTWSKVTEHMLNSHFSDLKSVFQQKYSLQLNPSSTV